MGGLVGGRKSASAAPASASASASAPASLAESPAAVIQRRRLAEGRTAIITTGVDEDATKATKQLLGS
jgi:hypothetical protein